jgi:hypothetical protein
MTPDVRRKRTPTSAMTLAEEVDFAGVDPEAVIGTGGGASGGGTGDAAGIAVVRGGNFRTGTGGCGRSGMMEVLMGSYPGERSFTEPPGAPGAPLGIGRFIGCVVLGIETARSVIVGGRAPSGSAGTERTGAAGTVNAERRRSSLQNSPKSLGRFSGARASARRKRSSISEDTGKPSAAGPRGLGSRAF